MISARVISASRTAGSAGVGLVIVDVDIVFPRARKPAHTCAAALGLLATAYSEKSRPGPALWPAMECVARRQVSVPEVDISEP
jgi:hypothetical protein